MKRFLLCLLLPLGALAQPSKDFTLKGTLKLSQPADWVYLRYVSNDAQVYDSIQPRQGAFEFSGQLDEPTVAALIVKFAPQGGAKAKREAVQLFLEPADMVFAAHDSLDAFTLTGSMGQPTFARLLRHQKPYDRRMDRLDEEYQAAKKEGREKDMKKLDAQMDELQLQMSAQIYGHFIRTQPKSPVALYALNQYAGWEIDPDAIEPLFQSLPPAVQQYPSALALKDRIEIAKKTAIGKYALDFSQADTNGRAVSLSSFRGKYVLVDFWASWCGPCRAENPNVVKAYNKFRDRNFTILGVSLDRPTGRDRWLKAIHDDGLAWNHVSDLKFWDNEVAKEYGIRAIPQNILVDPQGKIVAKNLNGTTLEAKLNELLGK
jgi:peroxiredoxin